MLPVPLVIGAMSPSHTVVGSPVAALTLHSEQSRYRHCSAALPGGGRRDGSACRLVGASIQKCPVTDVPGRISNSGLIRSPPHHNTELFMSIHAQTANCSPECVSLIWFPAVLSILLVIFWEGRSGEGGCLLYLSSSMSD